MKWTDAARGEMDAYLERIKAAYRGGEADPEEVAGDLRTHFEAAARDEQLVVIADHDVRRFIARFGPALGELDSAEGAARDRAAAPAAVTAARPRSGDGFGWMGAGGIWAFLFAVFIPGASYVVELVFRGCSDLFFEPMPSVWHHMAVLTVVAVNYLSWRSIRSAQPPSRWLVWGNQAVLILAAYFAIIFIPVLPIAAFGLVGIIYFGVGLLALLPMAPYFALIAAAGWRRQWNQRHDRIAARVHPWGALAAATLLVLMLAPYAVHHVGMRLAVSEDPAAEARGIRLLRSFGSRQILLHDCYGNVGTFRNRSLLTDVLGETTAEDARMVYYRVTGEPFNRALPRRRALGRRPVADLWDTDQGGARVGGRRPDVELLRSRLDGSVDADAAVGYLEWTMEFRNEGRSLEEARGVLQLPAGGVVSRLTLWIDGEEREAAFGGRAAVREAYQKVVHRRRDPVLVTTAGPDQVLFQCYPILPNGGTMQFRVGITFPLACTQLDIARFELPRVVERNYTVADHQQHAIWMESVHPMLDACNLLQPGGTAEIPGTLHGEISEADFRKCALSLSVDRNPDVHAAVAADYVDTSAVVRAELRETPAAPPQRIAVVIDASQSMAPYRTALQTWLQSWNGPFERRTFIAHDQVLENPPNRRAWPAFAGGCDNGPALVAAWDWAGRSQNGIVVWIHGPQPVGLGSTDALRQRIAWRPNGPVIHHLSVEPGPNRITEAFNPADPVARIPAAGSPTESLAAFADSLAQPALTWSFASLPAIHPDAAPTGNPAIQTSDHLVRLWKYQDLIARLRRQSLDTAGMADEAVAYMLVTPISGAVVLETQAQYAEAGLDDIDASQAPVHVIPEPQSLWLLLLGGGALFASIRRTRPRAGRHRPVRRRAQQHARLWSPYF